MVKEEKSHEAADKSIIEMTEILKKSVEEKKEIGREKLAKQKKMNEFDMAV